MKLQTPFNQSHSCFNELMEQISKQLNDPKLTDLQRADAMIAALAATQYFLHGINIEVSPLIELTQELNARRMGRPDRFSFDKIDKGNRRLFQVETIQALIIALYYAPGRRPEAYKLGRLSLKLTETQIQYLAQNFKHAITGDIYFLNLYDWAEREVVKEDFNINCYISSS